MNLDEQDFVAEREEMLTRRSGLSRRQLLKLGAAFPVAAGIARFVPAAPARAATSATTPILKPLPAEWFVKLGTNAEMRWDSVKGQGYFTANERFFVRNHTSTLIIDAAKWQLRVFGTGLSGDGASFTLEQLRSLPSREVTAFVECAGNGRSFFGSQQGTLAPGSQWGLGAIGVARWKGVPLAEVLQRAGATNQAVDVMPYGLDANVVTAGVDYGKVRRPIPIAKALDDALLVYEMNGEALPPDHGYPVRLLVPGWIGVANVKWIGQIEVSNQPLHSLWNTQQYVMLGADYPDKPLLTTQSIKSAWELARNATLPAGTTTTLTGRAWSGTRGIKNVDVSIDHGATWKPATLQRRNGRGNWEQFNFTFPQQPPGTFELWARATDNGGQTQPTTVPFNNSGYLFSAIVRHPVTVK